MTNNVQNTLQINILQMNTKRVRCVEGEHLWKYLGGGDINIHPEQENKTDK